MAVNDRWPWCRYALALASAGGRHGPVVLVIEVVAVSSSVGGWVSWDGAWAQQLLSAFGGGLALRCWR